MSVERFFWASMMTLVLLSDAFAQQELTILTDADAGVRAVCRWDEPEDTCLVPRGGDHQIIDDWSDNPRYIRVHDQNASDVGYWHFDLSGVNANADITEARFQVDAQSNSWGDTSVMVVAIVEESEDWDLDDVPEDEIFGGNAPKLDWSDWEDDPGNPMRFNSPFPFFDEGTDTDSEVRQLVDEFEPILIENQDAFTEGDPGDPGNSYGGFGCCDGPGTAGSADQGDNIWPIKNAVDVDITDLIRWKLGQNPDYSDITPTDRELTLMVRTEVPEFGGTNGFARLIAKESEFLGGELDLQPGRILLSGDLGGGVLGDFDQSGILDLTDVNLLSVEIATTTNAPEFDLTNDGLVNNDDLQVWVKDLRKTWFGDANLDGEFGSGDLVTVFAAGEYEDNIPQNSTWATGDWNADLEFTTGDLVAAFSDGGFERGPVDAQNAVPEPSTYLMISIGLALVACWKRKSRPHL